MAINITSNPDLKGTSIPASRVWLRELWSEAWVVKPYLYCDTCALRAAPEMSSAVLHYDYGRIIRPDLVSGGPVLYPPLSISGWYVKIEIDWFDPELQEIVPLLWYGIVRNLEKQAYGAPLDASNNPQALGRQKITCYGMEWLLQRETLRTSWVIDEINAGEEYSVNRPLAFNWCGARSMDHVVPNRSASIGVEGSYLFTTDLTTAVAWSSADIVQYLLAYESPKAPLGSITIPFTASGAALPNYDQPRIEVKTETLKELLDKLLSRKRLVSYYVTVEESGGGGEVQLVPFSFTAVDIVVPTSYQNATGGYTTGEGTIPANPSTVALDFDEAFDVISASLHYKGDTQYDQVIVRGSRKATCFTVGWLDEVLQEDWPSSLRTEYCTAASGQTGYASETYAIQQFRNQLWRSSEKYKRVFRWFCLPPTWDGESNNGEGTGTTYPVFPLDDDFEQTDTFYRPGLLFSHQLPLLTDHDYTQGNIAEGLVTDTTPSGEKAERLRPMAFLKVNTAFTDGQTRYQRCDHLNEVAKTDKHALGGASFTCSLRMQDRGLGVELNVHGAPQHAIASSSFTPAGASDLQPGTSIVIDYKNNLVMTLFVEADSYVEAFMPSADGEEDQAGAEEAEAVGEDEAEAEVADYVSTLLIDLSRLEHGNALRLDYVPTGTVVAIQDGILQRTTLGGYVRDDRGRLKGLALAAWNWYGVTRQAFTLLYRQIDGQFAIGDLITQIGGGDTVEEVNTPITSIEWDLVNGTTTIMTGFAELDFHDFL